MLRPILNLFLYTVHLRKLNMSLWNKEREIFWSHLGFDRTYEHQILSVLGVVILSIIRAEDNSVIVYHSIQDLVICEQLDIKTLELWPLKTHDSVICMSERYCELVLEHIQWKHVEKYICYFSGEVYQSNTVLENLVNNYFVSLFQFIWIFSFWKQQLES